MEEDQKEKNRVGIASMLQKTEIKGYFDSLFLLIMGVELLIFVAHFVSAVGPDNGVFPWKQYFFVSFITPVVLLFLIGLVILGFNYYLFGHDTSGFPEDDPGETGEGRKGLGASTRNLLLFLNQVPVLGSLLAIGLGAVILYKLDTILAVIGHVGERTAFYLFIILAVVLGGGLIFLLCWFFWKYRLHKLEMERRWEFRNKVMETSGMIILENNMVLDKDGRILAEGDARAVLEDMGEKGEKKALPFIPGNLSLK